MRRLAPEPDSSLYPLKNGDVPNGLILSVSRNRAHTSTVLRVPSAETSWALHMMSPQCAPPLNVGVEFSAGSVLWSFNRGEAVHRARKVPRGVEDRQPSVVSGSVTLPTTRQFSLPTFVAFPGAESRVLGMGQACFPEVPTDLCAGVRLQPSRTPGGAKGHPHLGESWRGARFSEDGAPVSPPYEVAAGPETTRSGDDQLGSSHSTGLVPSDSVRQKPCTKSIVFRTANGLRSEDPRMLSLRLPPRPRVSINTPGIAFSALATSGLPNPVVRALSAVHKLRVICSEGSRGA